MTGDEFPSSKTWINLRSLYDHQIIRFSRKVGRTLQEMTQNGRSIKQCYNIFVQISSRRMSRGFNNSWQLPDQTSEGISLNRKWYNNNTALSYISTILFTHLRKWTSEQNLQERSQASQLIRRCRNTFVETSSRRISRGSYNVLVTIWPDTTRQAAAERKAYQFHRIFMHWDDIIKQSKDVNERSHVSTHSKGCTRPARPCNVLRCHYLRDRRKWMNDLT